MAKKKFSLDAFKESVGVTEAVYKKEKFVVLNEALQEVLKLPGLPLGRITFDYGLSDSAKTTLLFEAAIRAQEQGILPVIILTGPEKKVDWSRARKMGLQYTGDLPKEQQVKDEFIIVEEGLDYLEDVFAFINNKIIKNVNNGKLPFNTMIFWDSAGNTLSRLAVEIDKDGNRKIKDIHMKNAKILGEELISLAPQIESSRKEVSPYYIGAFFITSMYQGMPAFPGSPAPWKIKGGNKPKFVSSLMIKHRHKKKLKATKNGAALNFGMVTEISVTKNHINGKEYTGEFVVTEDAILPNEKGAIDDYKALHSDSWGGYEVMSIDGEVFEGDDSRSIGVTTSKSELKGD